MHGHTDLAQLIARMSPTLDRQTYVFVTCAATPPGVQPWMTLVEDEGTTLVLPIEQAQGRGLLASVPMVRITLRVHSALEAVGLTAAVSSALARGGISCNVVAGYFHDHLFVPAHQGQDAMTVLLALVESGSATA